MCERCAALEAENEDLRMELNDLKIELSLKPRNEHACVFAVTLKLTSAESRVLALLYGARSLLSSDEIVDAIRTDEAQEYADTSKLAQVYIHKIRKKLGHDVVVCHNRLGYKLDDRGRALCKAAIDKAGDDLSEIMAAAPKQRLYARNQVRWVDDRQLLMSLKRLDDLGLSLGQIAKELRVTRAQVAGAVDRHIRKASPQKEGATP